jgi:5-methylcytosine-specific restriction protein A
MVRYNVGGASMQAAPALGERMIHQVLDDDGHALDAHLEIDGSDVVFHSRGGTKGKDAQNVGYSSGLRLLLQRIRNA